MQHMESVLCSSACLKELEELYTEAFPANERMPFSQMLSLSKDDRYALRALKDDGAFCGFSFIMRHEEMIYLFYLAVRQRSAREGIRQRPAGRPLPAVSASLHLRRYRIAPAAGR